MVIGKTPKHQNTQDPNSPKPNFLKKLICWLPRRRVFTRTVLNRDSSTPPIIRTVSIGGNIPKGTLVIPWFLGYQGGGCSQGPDQLSRPDCSTPGVTERRHFVGSAAAPGPQNPKTPKPQNPKTPKPQNPKTPKPQNPKTPKPQNPKP